MWDITKELIENLDKFHYRPQLGFKAKPKQGTLLGGLSTVLMGFMILYILINGLHVMYLYEGYYLKTIDTNANLAEIGILKLEDMGTLPFWSVHYKGH